MPTTRKLTVNGTVRRVDVEPGRPLLSVLREELNLTGTKYGCGEGQCGACTVLVDGTPTRSCSLPVEAVKGRKVTTIEALSKGERLHPLQQAFLDDDALQCAYCTSGMIVAGAALLQNNPRPTEEQIVQGMNGNICRCGTYRRIITAIQTAAERMRKEAV